MGGPPFSFHQSDGDSLLETTVTLEDELRLLHLHSVNLNPIETRNSAELCITVRGGDKPEERTWRLNDLLLNPEFRDKVIFKHATNVLLPPGIKRVTFSITGVPTAHGFKARLNCDLYRLLREHVLTILSLPADFENLNRSLTILLDRDDRYIVDFYNEKPPDDIIENGLLVINSEYPLVGRMLVGFTKSHENFRFGIYDAANMHIVKWMVMRLENA